ncbi:hypothetical protein BJK05_06210 [Pectobacterium polaris]|uniref:hypothetical protein n=1 Tax=Pectobacterium polaris TaxID=2042057 RepID=UPI000BACCA87|nr:hypothetical protein [Pectobacterium polaris]ASY79611.1 hypothetical protein BJK05_06210 [Pectobacterium polaris]MBN3215443.1 hypothetical protein [Pectobacterium polaris]RUR99502.1 hypothetical protein KHDHEBDM_01785 [Pectobacterium polaris]
MGDKINQEENTIETKEPENNQSNLNSARVPAMIIGGALIGNLIVPGIGGAFVGGLVGGLMGSQPVDKK